MSFDLLIPEHSYLLTDSEAIALRDELLARYPLDAEPPEEPPVEEPEPPVDEPEVPDEPPEEPPQDQLFLPEPYWDYIDRGMEYNAVEVSDYITYEQAFGREITSSFGKHSFNVNHTVSVQVAGKDYYLALVSDTGQLAIRQWGGYDGYPHRFKISPNNAVQRYGAIVLTDEHGTILNWSVIQGGNSSYGTVEIPTE